jgi:hypothetical protein
MAKGFKSGGRAAGVRNKTTIEVKAALEEAFEKRGGVPALMAWADGSPDEFYKLWAKLLPKDIQVAGAQGGPIKIIVMTGVTPPDPVPPKGTNGNGH